MRISKIRYGIRTDGVVVKEEATYLQEGTDSVSVGDPRLVSLVGEVGLWLLCCITNQLPNDAVMTDEATYLQYKTDADAAYQASAIAFMTRP